jgi:NADPH-dependent F420 reductase
MKEKVMNISILGTGNMAKGLAGVFAAAGYSVVLGSRDAANAAVVARELGAGVEGTDLKSAAERADVVVLAVPYGAAAETIAAAGGLDGKTVVDITNPMTDDYSGLTLGHTTSASEEIQKLAPRAKVVKAFNTIFASVLAAGGKAAGEAATVFIAGDDAGATATIERVASKAGFVPLQVGRLAVARYLEPLAGLNIALGYGRGLGTDIAPTWLRAA